MIYIIIMIFAVFILTAFIAGLYFYKQKKAEHQLPNQNMFDLHDLQKEIQQLHYLVNNVPSKITAAITGQISNYKGKLGELIAYINLRGSYDRIIALGDITDYICLTFPMADKPGKITFLDVKNGKSARLSADQKALKQIIKEKNIEFIKLEISTEDVLNADIAESDTTL